MTHFLVTEEKPDGYRLEDILGLIRRDIIKRSTKIMEDERPEARTVLENNVRILGLLTDAIKLAEDSTQIIERSFGKSVSGSPRIGKA